MDPQNTWKHISSEVVYENPYYKVRRDQVIRPDGKSGVYEIIDRHDSAHTVALTEDQKFHLIKLHRYPTDDYTYHIPAGGTDGDGPLKGAQRELQEETGLLAQHWQLLGSLPSDSSISSSMFHAFLATGLSTSEEHRQREEGISEIITVSFPEAFAMIQRGEINEAHSITVIVLAALHLQLI